MNFLFMAISIAFGSCVGYLFFKGVVKSQDRQIEDLTKKYFKEREENASLKEDLKIKISDIRLTERAKSILAYQDKLYREKIELENKCKLLEGEISVLKRILKEKQGND